MNKYIFIIHPSEIIRKGLVSIVRNFFNIEIIQLETMHDLDAYLNMKDNSLLVILQDSIRTGFEPLHAIRKQNRVKLIGIESHIENETSFPLDCEGRININTSSIELQDIISRCMKKGEKSSRISENEELTNREKEVLRLVALGNSNKVIAEKLYISIHTVISHRKNISEKTGIKSISGLTVYAILNNLINTDALKPDDLI